MQDPNRFNLPVIEFISEIVREKFPNMTISPGSAFYQTFIKPAAAVLQPFRDRLNLIKRNQSLANYPVMSTPEMDRRALNFLVTRQAGTRAYGVQRVFFDRLRAVYIDRAAVFFDDSDHRWNPIASLSMTTQELAPNYVAETEEYYADVTVVAEADGEEYRAEAGQVNQFSNIVGATRTINPADYFRGSNQESNSELFVRIGKSITNKDLVKADAIATAIMEGFSSVRAVKVVGMGDPDMTRDVVEAVVAVDEVLRYSFCRKVNLPLDENGEVNWFDASGNPIISPLGGYVGALVDVTGVDFNQLTLSFGSDISTIISVQPGFRAMLYQGYSGDPDPGEYTVTRVEEAPLVPNGDPVKVLRLDRAFSDPQIATWDPVTDLDKYSYTLYGAATTSHFHVGGKVDAYIDSTSDEEDSVIINVLPEITPGFSEIPLVATNPVNPSTNLPLFENNKPFRIPVLGILTVAQVDYEDDKQVERELLPDVNYSLVRAEKRGKYTRTPEDLLILKGFESDGVTPAFTGRRIKITYTTNPDVALVQSFVGSSANKDVTKDILVKSKNIAVLDIEMEYEGTLETVQVDEILSEYIKSKGFGGTVTAHEVDTLLALYGVTKVKHPIQFRLRRDLGNGVTESEASEDALTAKETEVFYPADTLSITKAG
jgi:hypothetical protein